MLALPAGARGQAFGKEEPLSRADPYTRGEAAALERAGYLSLGPFQWAEGSRTDDVEETLGAGVVLWVETAHFKLGSTLASYRLNKDAQERKALDAELARLKSRFAGFQAPRNKLDPWLRLHLFAQRLEDAHADFTAAFGFAGTAPPEKLRVVLAEKSSSLARVLKRFGNREPRTCDRFLLPGGALLLGVSAEGVRTDGFELDAGLHCVVASAITQNLADGYSGTIGGSPVWFEFGLGHVAARKVDERFTPFAGYIERADSDDSWKWDGRVRGLVRNDLAPSWESMLDWEKWEDIPRTGHLVAWSRVAWIRRKKPAELNAFLLALTRREPGAHAAAGNRVPRSRQEAAAQAAFGQSLAELDREWRKAVRGG